MLAIITLSLHVALLSALFFDVIILAAKIAAEKAFPARRLLFSFKRRIAVMEINLIEFIAKSIAVKMLQNPVVRGCRPFQLLFAHVPGGYRLANPLDVPYHSPGGLLLELAVCRPNGKSNKINACVNRAYSRLFVEVEV